MFSGYPVPNMNPSYGSPDFAQGLTVPKVELRLPQWLDHSALESLRQVIYPSDLEKMALAISLAGQNVDARTGGPFGAAIFDSKDKLVGVGVNLVVPQSDSTAHAEIVAIRLAESLLGTFDLGQHGPLTLATSAQPCAMCCGAIPWSGISKVIIGASAKVTEELTGFDEGPIHPNWRHEYERRGIKVVEGVLAEPARVVLTRYAERGGIIYNGSTPVSDC